MQHFNQHDEAIERLNALTSKIKVTRKNNMVTLILRDYLDLFNKTFLWLLIHIGVGTVLIYWQQNLYVGGAYWLVSAVFTFYRARFPRFVLDLHRREFHIIMHRKIAESYPFGQFEDVRVHTTTVVEHTRYLILSREKEYEVLLGLPGEKDLRIGYFQQQAAYRVRNLLFEIIFAENPPA